MTPAARRKTARRVRVTVDGDGVVELGDEGGLDFALGEQDGRALGHGLEHGERGVVDFDAAGRLGGGHGHAFDANDRLEFGQGDRLLQHDLGSAPAVAQDEKVDGAEAADGVQPALEENRLAGGRCQRQGEQVGAAGACERASFGRHRVIL